MFIIKYGQSHKLKYRLPVNSQGHHQKPWWGCEILDAFGLFPIPCDEWMDGTIFGWPP